MGSRDRRTRGGVIPSGLQSQASPLPPFFLLFLSSSPSFSSYPCCIPLLALSLPPLLFSSLLSAPLSPSVCLCVCDFKPAGPHPHRRCGCSLVLVLFSPVHRNSATVSTSLWVYTQLPSASSGTCQEEGGGAIGIDFFEWAGPYHIRG